MNQLNKHSKPIQRRLLAIASLVLVMLVTTVNGYSNEPSTLLNLIQGGSEDARQTSIPITVTEQSETLNTQGELAQQTEDWRSSTLNGKGKADNKNVDLSMITQTNWFQDTFKDVFPSLRRNKPAS